MALWYRGSPREYVLTNRKALIARFAGQPGETGNHAAMMYGAKPIELAQAGIDAGAGSIPARRANEIP